MTPRQQLDAALRGEKQRRAGVRRAKWTRDSRGRNHPSEGEAEWFDALYAREEAGEIRIVEIEPSFRIELSGQWLCNVKADARVIELSPSWVGPPTRVLDYKGHSGDTEVSRLKRKAVLIQHGIEIELVGRYIEQKARAKAKRQAERALLKRAKPKPKLRE